MSLLISSKNSKLSTTTNQELLQKIQNLDINKNTIANINSLDRDHEIKPFSCKYCDKSFLHVHEVKKHIEIHTSTSEVEEEKTKGATKNSWLLDHKIQEKKDHERKKPLNCTNSSPSKNNENTEIPTTSSKSVQDLIINTSPKHICGTCGKSFVSGRNLRVHIKNVHKGKKHIETHTST